MNDANSQISVSCPMLDSNRPLGWIRDIPDPRDFTLDTPKVKKFVCKNVKENLPSKVIPDDLHMQQPQGAIGSCTAHAGTYLYELHSLRAIGSYHDLSRLFLYKATRNLLGWKGDTGAYIRTAMQAMSLIGVPPESHYPYDISKYDNEPEAFLYSMAQNYQALQYYRLDPFGTEPETILARIKANISLKRACMFGFIVYGIDDKKGHILMPKENQRSQGGHAVVAVGYDDNFEMIHSNGRKTKGAIMIANSWGSEWGSDGFGWIPYWYVLNGLATDWWTMMAAEWTDLGVFNKK